MEDSHGRYNSKGKRMLMEKDDDMEKRTRQFGHQFNVRVGYPTFSTLCGHSSHVSHEKSGS